MIQLKQLLLLTSGLFIFALGANSQVTVAPYERDNPGGRYSVSSYKDFEELLNKKIMVKGIDFFIQKWKIDSFNDHLIDLEQFPNLEVVGIGFTEKDSLFENTLFDRIKMCRTIKALNLRQNLYLDYNFHGFNHVKSLYLSADLLNKSAIQTFDSIKYLDISETYIDSFLPAKDAPIFQLKTVVYIAITHVPDFPLESLGQYPLLKSISIDCDTIVLPESGWENLDHLFYIDLFGVVESLPEIIGDFKNLVAISVGGLKTPFIPDKLLQRDNTAIAILLISYEGDGVKHRKEKQKLNKLHKRILRSGMQICHDRFEKGKSFQTQYSIQCKELE